MWVDLHGSGPAALTSWTSSYSARGVIGEPELATKEKGELIYHEAVKQLSAIVDFFQERPRDQRVQHQARKPSIPIPWGQLDMES